LVDVVEEAHEPFEVGLLVVDVGEVAAARAVVVSAIGQLVGHRFQVGRVHGVMLGADDQGGDLDPARSAKRAPAKLSRSPCQEKSAGAAVSGVSQTHHLQHLLNPANGYASAQGEDSQVISGGASPISGRW